MPATDVRRSELSQGDVASVPPLDAVELRRFLRGAAPQGAFGLAVGLDPRVPLLPVAERLLARLGAEPEGVRLHVVTALPGDGRSTVAHQLATRLAERAELAVALWTRALPFDSESALAHVGAARTPPSGPPQRPVHVVDDAHEVVAELFRFARALQRSRGGDLPFDLVLLAERRAWVREGGEARPWLDFARELHALEGASGTTSSDTATAATSAPGAEDAGQIERDRDRVAERLAQASGRDDAPTRAALRAALEPPLGAPDASLAPTAPSATPEGALFRAVRTVLVGDEDAWRAEAQGWLAALVGVSIAGRPATEALLTLALPALVGLEGAHERLLARALIEEVTGADEPEAPPDGSALARLLAPLASVVPLGAVRTASGAACWTMRHPHVAGAIVDALVDDGAEPLRAPAERLQGAALAELAAGDDPRGDGAEPLVRRTARIAAALARPPEAVRWLLDDTGAEDLAVDLARRAAQLAPRVDLHADLVTALRRAGRADESCAAARDAWRALGSLVGAPEHARRLAGSWAISELRRGGERALERAVAVQLLALSDDVPDPLGRRPDDEALPRGPFEVGLRTLAWLHAEAQHAGADQVAGPLARLAPFAAAAPPERHERDEAAARIEVTRPSDVPFEPEDLGALLLELDALVRGARPHAEEAVERSAAPLSFEMAVRAYRRYVAGRIGPLVRVLPDLACSASPGDALQEAFEGWLTANGVNPYLAQMEAYYAIFGGSSVLLNTPTGSGKSLVALAAHFAALGAGQRSVYTAPTKALVNEKFFDLCRRFGSANVGLLTGDASVNHDAPIICCTAEILSSLAQVEGAARPFAWVVMDEFHYFSDRERGIAWLLPLLLLDGARFLLMSATIGEVHDAQRLVATLTGQPFELVRSTERPVPLVFRYKVATERDAINELRDTGLLPAYVVCVTRNEAAEKALAEPSSGGWSSKSVELDDHVFTSPFGRQLKRALRSGIGLHHSGLLPKYRRLVEKLSAANQLRLIFGTDTLGVGVNLPIRTVLFPQLVRNSGRDEYVRLDAARFQQLAGRAGRAGYAEVGGDPQGDVWVLAPEDELERQKAAAKAAAKGGKSKKPAPKSSQRPGPKMPSWSEQTMQNLAASPARPLEVRFEVSAALVMNFVRRGARGVERLRELIATLPLKPAEREALARDVERVLATLVARREVRAVGAVTDAAFAVGERSVRRDADEAAGAATFDRPLLRFLHDVAWDFLPEDDGPALDLLSLVESVVDDPRVVLGRQAKKLRDELWQAQRERDVDAFDQSARREHSEERQEIEHPKPLEAEIAAAFAAWDEAHAGLARQAPSAKSVVRDMFELGMGFREYVQHYGLSVVEGELLRHLSEVWRVLVKGLPPGRDVERGTKEICEWLGALVRHVDSSLIDEWERLADPERAAGLGEPEPLPLPYDVTANPRAFTRMVRNAAFRWVRALAARQYDALANEHVSAAVLAAAHEAYLAECGRLELGAAARSPALCDFTPGRTRVEQTLADPEAFHEWSLVGAIDLDASREEGDAVLVLHRFERKAFGLAEDPDDSDDAGGDDGPS